MLPELSLRSVSRITDDTLHHAFTDLCRFHDALYLTFRSCPAGHGISSESFVQVMRSDDGMGWREVHRFSVPERDTRDPHFLVFGDRLIVYTGTWDATPEGVARRELNDHLGYAVRSEDGTQWSAPIALESTRGHYVWRGGAFGNTAYLCGRRKSGFVTLPNEKSEWSIQESVMLASRDGITFSDAALFQDSYGDETAFAFDENGGVVALVRCRNWEQPAFLCRAQPPYSEWERVQLDRNVGGPMLARWGNFLLAGGRRTVTSDDPTAVLYWLEEDRLVEALELPSGGDCSYPGFVELEPQRALVSYYSSHEGNGDPQYPASVYLAEVTIE